VRRAIGRALPTVLLLVAFAAAAAPLEVPSATAGGEFGLYRASDFVVSTGACTDCSAIRQAKWYFRDEIIAVPRAGRRAATFESNASAFDDVRHWMAARPTDAPIDYPPLVWIAAPQILRDARMGAEGSELLTPDGTTAFRPAAKIPLNRAYYDASSVAYFSNRTLSVRGVLNNDVFVGRSIWPRDYRVGTAAPPARELSPQGDAAGALRALMREQPRGGARSTFDASTLWQRNATENDWTGRTVLGLMVNGAQGDDDEAEGGHFAIVTGRIQRDGQIGEWLVNNFYSLDVESEKGILAAPVPLDNYLGDLNAGQGWYRPSYMVVAVLSDERAAVLVQSALNRVYNQFWRHQLLYYHPTENCASISVDALGALGWRVPRVGPTSLALAWLAYPLVAIKEWSIGKAKLAFDYLNTDQTRLLPAVALEQAFASLLALGNGVRAKGDGALAQMLAEDLDAVALVRFPQFPSSRVFGDAPAVSAAEYRLRVPADPALAQIVPVPPRPFPIELRDPDLRKQTPHPSDYATVAWGAIIFIGLPFALWRGRVRYARRRLERHKRRSA
jgi:hypothetical protein